MACDYTLVYIRPSNDKAKNFSQPARHTDTEKIYFFEMRRRYVR
jgi:hypothetical protein